MFFNSALPSTLRPRLHNLMACPVHSSKFEEFVDNLFACNNLGIVRVVFLNRGGPA